MSTPSATTTAQGQKRQPWIDVISSLSWDSIYFTGAPRYPMFHLPGVGPDYFFTGPGPRNVAWRAGSIQRLHVAVVGGGRPSLRGEVTVTTPPGWHAKPHVRRFDLRSRESMPDDEQFVIDVAIPPGAPSGTQSLTISACAGSVTASVRESVLVLTDEVQVDLSTYFNQDVISTEANKSDGNLGATFTYPAEELPHAGPVTLAGVKFIFPGAKDGTNNAVEAAGQVITVPPGRYNVAIPLGFSVFGPATGNVTATYADGSTATVTLTFSDWLSVTPVEPGDTVATVTTHAHHATEGDVYFQGGVFGIWPRILTRVLALDPTRDLVSLTLPSQAQIHLLAMTLNRV